jgi:hypothetical protein
VEQNKGRSHDVIVACSGGKDSTAQIVKCLELGLKPLAITATTDHLSPLGRKNLDNISRLIGRESHIEVTPDPEIRKRVAKFSLQEIGDISWCEHVLIWSIPAREAVARGIPVVLYGECPQNEYGAGPAGSEAAERLTKSWVHEFGGLIGQRIIDIHDHLGIHPDDMPEYHIPDDGFISLWMGQYFPWDGYQNYLTAREYGFMPYEKEHVERSLYNYENLDNLQTGIHDFLRWCKFGYTRADDIASNHIRRGRLTRDEAVELVLERNETKFPCTYLGVTFEEILANIDVTISEYCDIKSRFINTDVISWASKPESYQSFSTMSGAASRGDNSITIAA